MSCDPGTVQSLFSYFFLDRSIERPDRSIESIDGDDVARDADDRTVPSVVRPS